MDITVKALGDGTIWQLTDLLGRSMGTISKTDDDFIIVPAAQALEIMRTLKLRPFRSLDAALAEIEMRTRGSCRLIEQRRDVALPAIGIHARYDEAGFTTEGFRMLAKPALDLIAQALSGLSVSADALQYSVHDLTQIAASLRAEAVLHIPHAEGLSHIERACITTAATGQVVFLTDGPDASNDE